MTTWLAIAAKPPTCGKSRLAPSLTPAQRAELCRAMARHVLYVASTVLHPGRCLLVSASPELHGLARHYGVTALKDENLGLNAAFTLAAQYVRSLGATSLLTLNADLPWLQPADVQAMLDAPGEIVIAPDRRDTGTNALLMRPAGLMPYSHGPESYRRHCAAARTTGLRWSRISRPGLARDLDLPQDMPAPLFRLVCQNSATTQTCDEPIPMKGRT